MSFHFSQDKSSLSLQSDYSSESSFSSVSKTLSQSGAKILNSSFPLTSRKEGLKKENETYAYLEKLKYLEIPNDGIEHIRYLRRLEYGGDSFMNLEAKPDFHVWTSNKSIGEKAEKNDYLARFIDPVHPTDSLLQTQVKFLNSEGKIERYGILLQWDLILTVHQMTRGQIKALAFTTHNGQNIEFNRLGPLILEKDFTIIPINNCNISAANVSAAFRLQKMEKIYVLGSNTRYDMYIVEITQKYFAFTCLGFTEFIKGVQIYSTRWDLQGIYSHSILDLHFAYRFEPILSYLFRHKSELNHPSIDKTLLPYNTP